MASSSLVTEKLEEFLRDHDARLHPSICIAENHTSGLHWRAKDAIEPGCNIVSCPHTLSLSYLNALVDEDWPVFKQCRQRLNPDYEVEAISFFYLMIQYANRETSFWKPYLDALPEPDSEHTQPLFYEDAEDIAWLQGTDVWHTNETRIKRYRAIFEDGKSVLEAAACDVSWCTWDMFRWAAATFTSRSFASRSLRPHDSKYWAAYRHGKEGRLQTVLIDMSHASASDFPVLFPGLDIGNHSNEAKIDYIFNSARFDIKTNTATAAGEEVFNNYGPKGNDELLLGYGFCIPDNPHNKASLSLKAPPAELRQSIKAVHPGYFKASESDGGPEWDTEKATFQLSNPRDLDSPDRIFEHLPGPLIELLIYVLHHERGYGFEFVEQPGEYITSGDGKRFLPHVANIMAQSLLSKLEKLRADGLPPGPSNAKQQQAAIYRQDQRQTNISLLLPFQNYLRSLVALDSQVLSQSRRLVRLETLVQFCDQNDIVPPGFMDGIEVNSNTRDMDQLRLAGWEQDSWILLLSALSLTDNGPTASFVKEHPAYVNVDPVHLKAHSTEIEKDPDHPSHGLMELVRTAADAVPGSIWESTSWSAALLSEHAKRLDFDGFLVTCPTDNDGDEEPRLCVYMH